MGKLLGMDMPEVEIPEIKLPEVEKPREDLGSLADTDVSALQQAQIRKKQSRGGEAFKTTSGGAGLSIKKQGRASNIKS